MRLRNHSNLFLDIRVPKSNVSLRQYLEAGEFNYVEVYPVDFVCCFLTKKKKRRRDTVRCMMKTTFGGKQVPIWTSLKNSYVNYRNKNINMVVHRPSQGNPSFPSSPYNCIPSRRWKRPIRSWIEQLIYLLFSLAGIANGSNPLKDFMSPQCSTKKYFSDSRSRKPKLELYLSLNVPVKLIVSLDQNQALCV